MEQEITEAIGLGSPQLQPEPKPIPEPEPQVTIYDESRFINKERTTEKVKVERTRKLTWEQQDDINSGQSISNQRIVLN